MHASTPASELLSSVAVERCKNPSVSSEEDDVQDGSTTYDLRHPACLYMEGGAMGLLSGDFTDDSEKTECVSFNLEEEEEEEEESAYDRPHVMQVDMGDGDMVTGYTQK